MEVTKERFNKEVEAFVGKERKVKLVSGREIVVKSLTWKKELKIINLLSKFFENKDITSSSPNLIKILLEEAPEVLTEICHIVTDLEYEVIENEFVLEDVIEVCFPFLESLLKRLIQVLTSKIIPLFNQITPQIVQNLNQ